MGTRCPAVTLAMKEPFWCLCSQYCFWVLPAAGCTWWAAAPGPLPLPCKFPHPINHWCLCRWLWVLSLIQWLGNDKDCETVGHSPIISIFCNPFKSSNSSISHIVSIQAEKPKPPSLFETVLNRGTGSKSVRRVREWKRNEFYSKPISKVGCHAHRACSANVTKLDRQAARRPRTESARAWSPFSVWSASLPYCQSITSSLLCRSHSRNNNDFFSF